MSWQVQAGINGGYPLDPGNTVFAPLLSAPYPERVMRIDGETNEGYPFLYWMSLSGFAAGVARLYFGSQLPTALCYGGRPVTACYFGSQLVYRPA